MPLVFRLSLVLLLAALALGQLWLHDAASPGAVRSAKAALASCPSVGASGSITSEWDVVRANDRVRMRRLAAVAGLADPC